MRKKRNDTHFLIRENFKPDKPLWVMGCILTEIFLFTSKRIIYYQDLKLVFNFNLFFWGALDLTLPPQKKKPLIGVWAH